MILRFTAYDRKTHFGKFRKVLRVVFDHEKQATSKVRVHLFPRGFFFLP